MKCSPILRGYFNIFLAVAAICFSLPAMGQNISTYAGTGTSGDTGDGGAATNATLGTPNGIAADTLGNVYVSDYLYHVVRKIDASGIITTIAGNGTGGYAGDGGDATNAMLNLPQGVCVDRAGNIYIADNGNLVIRKVNAYGVITTYAGTGTHGYSGDGGAATAATLNGSFDVAADRAGNLYIADGTSAIRIVSPAGIINTFAGNSTISYTGDGGPATAATLDGPSGVDVDRFGNVYIADNDNNVIREVNTSGIISTVAGNGFGAGTFSGFGGSGGYSGDGGAATAASLNNPSDITVDANGNLYIADQYNSIIRFVQASTGIISTNVGVAGSFGYSGDGGPATAANINFANYTAVDPYNNLYIADYSNSVVRFVPGAPAITIATATDTVCGRTPVTFTSTITVGGTVHYNWHINSTSVGGDSPTFVADSVHNGDTVYCVLTGTTTSIVLGTSNDIVMTVHPAPFAGSISGTGSICGTISTTLTESATGGAWSSSLPAIATISSTGTVTGVSGGTTTISYLVTSAFGCGTAVATYPFTVGFAPSSAGTITGTFTVCTGLNVTLSDTTGSGAWNSSNTAIATVSSTGVVTGVAGGPVTIIYTNANGCGSVSTSHAFTVNTAPVVGAISGPAIVCATDSITLSDTTASGTWSSTNNTLATVTSSGVVYGVSAGIDTIKYTVTGTCGAITVAYEVTVNALPVAGTITGATHLCTSATTPLSDASASGTGSWSSSAPGIASVDPATGLVYGLANGVATITFTISGYCGTVSTTHQDTVNISVSAGTISGASSICATDTVRLSESATGGSWSTSGTTIATVSATGLVTGVAAGAVTISYTVVSACGTSYATYPFTVNPLPNAGSISGVASVCTGSSISLFDAAGSGSWSSDNNTVATVDASGNVFGNTAGATNILYTVTNSCGTDSAVHAVTVNATAVAGTITGTSSVCVSANITMTDTTSGGIWSSGSTTNATVSSTGVVYGVAAGTATISYTVTTACNSSYATFPVTINPLPAAGTVSGPASVCIGSTITMVNTGGSGGTWASSNTTVATVDAAGVVHPSITGTTFIGYYVSNVCGTDSARQLVAVITNPVVDTISGSNFVCVGGVISLADATSGGSWTSSSTSTATVDASGNVYGAGGGVATISYSVTNACSTTGATMSVTVGTSPIVAPITGLASVCVGDTTTLGDAIAGGTWTSSASTLATVSSSSGLVTGVSGGTMTITYTIVNACGSAATLHTMTINTLPVAGYIYGPSSACPGNVVTVSDASGGGAWISSNPSVATISSSGAVTAVAAGSTTISYSVTGICGTVYATYAFTVNPDPFAGIIAGPDSVCVGATITMTDTITGGRWLSGSATVATVDASGNVTGLSRDTVNIIYSVSTVCGTVIAARRIYVNALPSPGTIAGATHLCVAGITLLACTVGGTDWTSSNNNAYVSSAGVLTGYIAGIDTIFHIVGNTCGRDTAFYYDTIAAHLTTGLLGRGDTTCVGDTLHLPAPVAGGVWTASNSNATIDTLGRLIAHTAGIDTITYTINNSCGVSSTSVAVLVRSSSSCGTGVYETPATETQLHVFPNPALGMVHILLSAAGTTEGTVQISDLLGKRVKETSISTNKELEITLDIPSGIYFVTVMYNGERTVRKLIVE